jgi:hypothetical protein
MIWKQRGERDLKYMRTSSAFASISAWGKQILKVNFYIPNNEISIITLNIICFKSLKLSHSSLFL